jgi:hypothetical protein
MASMTDKRPDLALSNRDIANCIAGDGSHFKKHGRDLCRRVSDTSRPAPEKYADLIYEMLEDAATYGFTSRVDPRALGLQFQPGKKVPEHSKQVYYNPGSELLVIIHLSLNESGEFVAKGTAYRSNDGHDRFLRLIEIAAEDGNHQVSELRNLVSWSIDQAKRESGGRDAILARCRQKLGISIAASPSRGPLGFQSGFATPRVLIPA